MKVVNFFLAMNGSPSQACECGLLSQATVRVRKNEVQRSKATARALSNQTGGRSAAPLTPIVSNWHRQYDLFLTCMRLTYKRVGAQRRCTRCSRGQRRCRTVGGHK